MQLPVCSKVHSIGDSLIITQCAAKVIEFNVAHTLCAPHPFYENFTIGIAGWELVRFKSCYHPSNFININGIAHHFVNDTWQQVRVDVQVTEHHLTSMFTTTVDNAFNYTSHRNPGTDQNSPNHIVVMADIIAGCTPEPTRMNGRTRAKNVERRLLTSTY